jgi:hypothetical protein
VDAAGAVMNSDASTASMSFVVDQDDMVSNSATKVPTQQSVVAYVGAEISDAVSSAALMGAVSLTATRMGLLTDANGVIEGNNASNITYSVPNNSTVAHPVGTILYFEQIGAGDIIMDYESGVTGEAMKTFGIGFTLSIRKTATNTWKVQNASPAYVTQAEYDALSTAIKNNPKMQFNIVP